MDTSKFTKSVDKKLDGTIFSDASGDKQEVQVVPIPEQGEMESRRVWKEVADGIRAGNIDLASVAKNKLENNEREKRKNEKASGSSYPLQRFTLTNDDVECKLYSVARLLFCYPIWRGTPN